MARPIDERTQPLRPVSAEVSPWVLDGRYRVLHRLGAGGTAEVFRARDLVLDRDVAVKVFRTLAVDDGGSAERRQLELTALAGLSHPNLIALLDGSLNPGTQPYLVLEFVDGPNLESRLRDGALPEPEVRIIAAQVADALAYAHARGVVHRDVKPANILLGSDGPDDTVRARLSDFGTVRLVDSARMTAPELTIGTASYLSPEQARGGDVGPESDIYSLGLVLIEALSGRRCFSGLVHEALAARLTRSPGIPEGLPEPWPRLLATMTSRVPVLRPAAAQVAETLRAGAAPQPLSRRVDEPERVPSLPRATAAATSGHPFGRDELSALHTATWFGRHAWLLIAAMLVAGLGVGVALTLTGHPDRSTVDGGSVSSATRHPSRSASSTAPPTSSATTVNSTPSAPVVIATRHVRSSTAAASPSHPRRARTTQRAVRPPITSAQTTPPSVSPSDTPSSATPTSPPSSSSTSPSPSPPTSVPTSPTPPPSP